MDLGLLLAVRLDVAPFSGLARAAGEPEPLSPPATPPSAAWIRDAVRAVLQHQRSGRPERAWPILRVLEPLLPRLDEGDPGSAGRIVGALATQALVEGDVEAFLDRARRAAGAFDRAADAGAAGVERASLGAGYRLLGVWDEAERELDAALHADVAGAPGEGFRPVLARSKLDLARVRWARGAEAGPLATQAAELFAANGDTAGEGVARGYLAGMLAGAAAGHEARRAGELLAASAGGRAFAGAALARALLVEGRIGEALAAAEQAAGEITAAGRLDEGEVAAWLTVADARRVAEDRAGADAAFDRARRLVLADAAKLRDAALRRAFLESVPEHRRALEQRR